MIAKLHKPLDALSDVQVRFLGAAAPLELCNDLLQSGPLCAARVVKTNHKSLLAVLSSIDSRGNRHPWLACAFFPFVESSTDEWKHIVGECFFVHVLKCIATRMKVPVASSSAASHGTRSAIKSGVGGASACGDFRERFRLVAHPCPTQGRPSTGAVTFMWVSLTCVPISSRASVRTMHRFKQMGAEKGPLSCNCLPSNSQGEWQTHREIPSPPSSQTQASPRPPKTRVILPCDD